MNRAASGLGRQADAGGEAIKDGDDADDRGIQGL
jgi:hypothetical protein